MRQLVRSLPRFIQDPLIEHRWFRRLFGGHFERWLVRDEPQSAAKGAAVRFHREWFPMMACTAADPAWHHLVTLRIPEFVRRFACEEHR